MIANAITISRVLLAGFFAAMTAVYLRSGHQTNIWLVLLSTAVAAETTDLLDGWAARRAKTASEFGGLLDPLCDSLSRLTMFFAAALAGWITLAVPLTMVARDLIVAYARVAVARTGGQTSARISGKIKALTQGAALLAVVILAGSPAAKAAGESLPAIRTGIAAVVLAVTIWSLVDYVTAAWPAITKLTAAHKRH